MRSVQDKKFILYFFTHCNLSGKIYNFGIMKIIAIGRNYAEHAKELNNPVPGVPVIFMKPDTALLKDNKPFYHPDFSEDIHHEIGVVLKLSKEGKHISEKFAVSYFEE